MVKTHREKGPLKIGEVAQRLGLDPETVVPYGFHMGKVPASELLARKGQRNGHLVLVTAMSPTPRGEGKTTTTIGIGDALRALGERTAICIREPSLGPYFGIKGGGTGAGMAQVVPAEAINLHFTGDMDAVAKANNLLAAMLDNHLQHGDAMNMDPRRITLRRVVDMNDRALREIVIGLGGAKNGVPRAGGFDITPASEVMAILCMAKDAADLARRLENMVVAFTKKGTPVFARDLEAVGGMKLLLKDALNPNLVQTLEGTPALVHAGPFANIAQGTSSAIATRLALRLADYVVTEGGFGTELGAEKFFHIKCRNAGLRPSAAVIVATAKAVAYHGGTQAGGGFDNLQKHVENIRRFGVEPVVAINQFPDDKPADLKRIETTCAKWGVEAVLATHFRDGSKGALNLARAVRSCAQERGKKKLQYLYPLKASLDKKIHTVATEMYGAADVIFTREARASLKQFEKLGYGGLPMCIAKTPLSLSDNPKLRGRPEGFKVTVNELRLSAGAGFVVAICGNVVTMPGLPRVPAAVHMND